MSGYQSIFSRNQYKLHRDKAASNIQHSIYESITSDLGDRLSLCKIPNKGNLLEFGRRGRGIEHFISKDGVIDTKVNADISLKMLEKSNSAVSVQCDEETLPFKDKEFDIVISNLHLHWSNNIPLALSNFYRVLKEGGVFIGAMIGGESLKKLRDIFVEVEKAHNQINYHFSPMIRLDSLPVLMQQIGFREVVVDSYLLRLEYASFGLMLQSFQMMGESNCLSGKVSYLSRKVLEEVEKLYCKSLESKDLVYCDIEILNVIGYRSC